MSTDKFDNKYILTGADQQHLNVLKNQSLELQNVNLQLNKLNSLTDRSIEESEQILRKLGLHIPKHEIHNRDKKDDMSAFNSQKLKLRTWDEILADTEQNLNSNASFSDIFTVEEIQAVENKLGHIHAKFTEIHRLDKLDWAICGVAGVLAAIVDVFLVKMPKHSGFLGSKSSEGGPLANFIREKIQRSMSPNEIRQLEKDNWVPYDASHSGSLHESVAGLGPRTHRYQSLGHDPLLGFIFGTMDIMKSQFTTVDKFGRLIVQNIDIAGKDTVGMNIFEALSRVFGHMKSDIATSAGLPAPLMPLFQFLQFGKIHKQDYTIGEVSRIMYRQGYDFSHFLTMSVPVLIIEVIVRLCYFAKRLYEGNGLMQSIPINIPNNKKPKLQTMLFSAHLIATAVNTGKVAITKNPLSINYPQWIAFFKYSFQQFKWVVFDKEREMLDYVQKEIDDEWDQIDSLLNATWKKVSYNNLVL
ncbi:hypothetical protein A8L34_23135 [Bacillus sp. FJAT-27264]|uniref:hypothetical protein n=1 Tax=Paenibacillus sp. (strain DSM 101736 / FJAT-27264) TaxID=1850362 RepID=UPI000807E095|nr:hypothetical protein [Bacillus sp. FJAT-27264]OBZ09043.1 hypothetical protein A8L34_23135 [Bacillus sp. FJAT-27264]